MAKATKYSQQFKEDAVRYRQEHPDLPLSRAAANLGISESALKTWCCTAKEIARIQRELRDAKDALEVLKKPSVSWENAKSNLCCYC